ncbi:MAG: hypothetical protein ACYDHT_04735 [Solirubrobacteraceae bacterium]
MHSGATAISRAAIAIASGKAATPLATVLAETKARVSGAIGATTGATEIVRSLAGGAPAVAAALSDLSTTAHAIVKATAAIAQPAIAELHALGAPVPSEFAGAAPAGAAVRQIAGPSVFAVRTSTPLQAGAPVARANEARSSAAAEEMLSAADGPRTAPRPIVLARSAPTIAVHRSSPSTPSVSSAPSNGYLSGSSDKPKLPTHAAQRVPSTAPFAVRTFTPAPDGGSAAASAGGAGGLALALSVAVLLMLAAPSMLRRLRLVVEPWRLSPFMLIADRPG